MHVHAGRLGQPVGDVDANLVALDDAQRRPRPHGVVAQGPHRGLEGVELPVHLIDADLEHLPVAVDGRLEGLVPVGHLRELGVIRGLADEGRHAQRAGQVAHEPTHLLPGRHIVLRPAAWHGLAGDGAGLSDRVSGGRHVAAVGRAGRFGTGLHGGHRERAKWGVGPGRPGRGRTRGHGRGHGTTGHGQCTAQEATPGRHQQAGRDEAAVPGVGSICPSPGRPGAFWIEVGDRRGRVARVHGQHPLTGAPEGHVAGGPCGAGHWSPGSC
ncbi:hypothetical protein BH24CHL9_BH24CHL9_02250 [soil metagenome]